MALNPQEAKKQYMIAQAAKQVEDALLQSEKRLDAEIDKLQNLSKDDIHEIRKKRIQEMKERANKEQEWRALGHGEYTEVSDQREWFDRCKTSDRVICHFGRPTTIRCQIVDKHLKMIASKHIETKFIYINAEKAPFLAQRLNIVLLPTIVCMKDNYTLDMIEGFDELGGTDDFPTAVLEQRLSMKGAIDLLDGPSKFDASEDLRNKNNRNTVRDNKEGKAIYQSRLTQKMYDSDDEWDNLSD